VGGAHLVCKFVNRMIPSSDSQICKSGEVHPLPIWFTNLFPLTNGRGRRPVYNLHIGWHPPKVHTVNILWTERLAIRFSNFKKMTTGWLRPGALNLQKSIKIKNLTSSSFFVVDKHCTMVEKFFLPFNHPQNLQKRHYKSCIWEKTQRLVHYSLVRHGWVGKKNDVF